MERIIKNEKKEATANTNALTMDSLATASRDKAINELEADGTLGLSPKCYQLEVESIRYITNRELYGDEIPNADNIVYLGIKFKGYKETRARIAETLAPLEAIMEQLNITKFADLVPTAQGKTLNVWFVRGKAERQIAVAVNGKMTGKMETTIYYNPWFVQPYAKYYIY